MGLPDLSALPWWAQLAVYIGFGGTFAVGVFLARMGLVRGKAAPAVSSSNNAMVAAVIVDPEALNRGTAEVAALNIVLREGQATARSVAKDVSSAALGQARAQRGSNAALEKIVQAIERLTDAVDKLTDEVIRSGK